MQLNSTELIGKTVSFDTHANHILATPFDRVVYVGLLDTDSARHIEDVAGLSEAVYPSLPGGTPTDYRRYQWVKVKMGDGSYRCLATHWIKDNTVTVHEDVALSITITKVNASDMDKVLSLLRANGYTSLKSKIL